MVTSVRTPTARRMASQLPYSENKNRGRRTGKDMTKEVDRDEDGFEDFGEMAEANAPVLSRPLTPIKKRTPAKVAIDLDDGYQDMFAVNDSAGLSHTPTSYVANLSRPAPSSVSHIGSLSRRAERSRPIDYDAIPSPSGKSGPNIHRRAPSMVASLNHTPNYRPKPTPNRAVNSNPSVGQSFRKTTSRVNVPEPPTFDSSFSPQQLDSGSLDEDEPISLPRKGSKGKAKVLPSPIHESDSDSDSEPASPPPVPVTKASGKPKSKPNTTLDSDEENNPPEPSPRSSHQSRNKGKARARTVSSEERESSHEPSIEPDPPMDDYSDVEPADEDIEAQVSDREDEPQPKKKKDKSKIQNRKRALTPVAEEEEDDVAHGRSEAESDVEQAPKPKRRKKNKAAPSSQRSATTGVIIERGVTADAEDGVRRSTRRRHKPLEYWRGERVILGRADDGPAPCPVIKGFLTIPKEIPQPLGIAGKKRKRRARSTSRAPTSRGQSSVKKEIDLTAPEAGWDDETEEMGLVLNVDTGEETMRRVAVTAARMHPAPARADSFLYQKIFAVDDVLASGILALPVGGAKPLKGTKDNTYVFFCHAGAVKITIHKSNYVIAQGGTFLVPKGNLYYIENISQRETVLFFAQARKVPEYDDEYSVTDSAPPSSVRNRSSVARSSVARSSVALTPRSNRSRASQSATPSRPAPMRQRANGSVRTS